MGVSKARRRLLVLVCAPLLATGIFGAGAWVDERESKRFDKAEVECLRENYCKKNDCTPLSASESAKFDAELHAWSAKQPRQYALPDEMPDSSLDPAEIRSINGSAPDECQRPPTSNWDFKAGLLAGVIAVPWSLGIVWLLLLAMIRSIARAARAGTDRE